MSNIRIYVEQYGRFWSFNPKMFLIMVRDYIRTHKTFDFSTYGKRLSNPPYPHVYKSRSSNKWSNSTPGTFLYHTTDWEEGDYLEAFKEISKEIQKRGKR